MDFAAFLPVIGGSAWTVIVFVIALSVIVAIHEYGHYIVGRWSGIHADVFSIGFGPVLWSRFDKRGTRWQVAALPLGGYVKFAGDSNAASGKDGEALRELSEEDARRTMHGAPLWARSATVAAGPVFNFILSALIFTGFLLFSGKAVEPLTIADIRAYPEGANGLQSGDVILEINGAMPPSGAGFAEFTAALPDDGFLPYKVLRNDQELQVTGPHPLPPAVSAVTARSAARDAGVEIDDVITAIDGVPVASFEQMKEIILASEGAPVTLAIWRAGEEVELTLAARPRDHMLQDGSFEKRWQIGIAGGLLFEQASEGLGLWDSVTGGIVQTGAIIRLSLTGLYNIAAGAISACNISGPIGIAQTASAMADQGAVSFIQFIALLSTAVGLLNLFPIPVLDGGHLVFFGWEAVTGKAPGERALQILMTIGLSLMAVLMIFALTNDLFCV